MCRRLGDGKRLMEVLLQPAHRPQENINPIHHKVIFERKHAEVPATSRNHTTVLVRKSAPIISVASRCAWGRYKFSTMCSPGSRRQSDVMKLCVSAPAWSGQAVRPPALSGRRLAIKEGCYCCSWFLLSINLLHCPRRYLYAPPQDDVRLESGAGGGQHQRVLRGLWRPKR